MRFLDKPPRENGESDSSNRDRSVAHGSDSLDQGDQLGNEPGRPWPEAIVHVSERDRDQFRTAVRKVPEQRTFGILGKTQVQDLHVDAHRASGTGQVVEAYRGDGRYHAVGIDQCQHAQRPQIEVSDGCRSVASCRTTGSHKNNIAKM